MPNATAFYLIVFMPTKETKAMLYGSIFVAELALLLLSSTDK